MRSLYAFLRDLFRPVRVYPCQECGRPMTSPEARLLHAVFTECGLADAAEVDDEEFCGKCFAGTESSEHREKCGEPA